MERGRRVRAVPDGVAAGGVGEGDAALADDGAARLRRCGELAAEAGSAPRRGWHEDGAGAGAERSVEDAVART